MSRQRSTLTSISGLSCVVALTLATVASASDLEREAERHAVDWTWGLSIPLRDGVSLGATRYLPRDQKAPAPCVFELTPYIGDTYHERGMYFASHGYPFLIVDVRGRGNSGGSFHPMIQEAKDGYDVVEWVARQPYCNGKVAMWGGSYAGYDQWAVAKTSPPHLATIVPAAAAFPGVEIPGRSMILDTYWIQWLTYVSGHALQASMFADQKFWQSRYLDFYRSGAGYDSLDTWVGNPSAILQEWVSHPDVDSYWDAFSPTAAEFAGIQIPILTITGIYDGDQLGALEFYRRHRANASASVFSRHFLVIGPWDHAGTRTPKAAFGGLKFGPASLVDLPKLHLDWYAYAMSDGPRPTLLVKPVAYYITGAEAWNYADSLEAITSEQRRYYLHSAGSASDVFNSGSLSPAAGLNEAPDHITCDPADTSLAAMEASLDADDLTSQRMVFARGGREFVYHTAPFDKDTELSGFFHFTAWIGIDRPDADFSVSVYEITRDGSSIFLSDAKIRARYRESLRKPTLVRSSAPRRYEFSNFTFVSRVIAAGSRLRLTLDPNYSIQSERNFGGAGPVASETIADSHPVTITLYHDSKHSSYLALPMGAARATLSTATN